MDTSEKRPARLHKLTADWPEPHQRIMYLEVMMKSTAFNLDPLFPSRSFHHLVQACLFMPLISQLLPQSFRFCSRTLLRVQLQRPSFTTSAIIMAQEYKIKGLSALDLKNGEKREVEVEGIENGKVLLARVGGTTHAMSSNCTHYGAPLKLGVLTPEGRLTCAWHGGKYILFPFLPHG